MYCVESEKHLVDIFDLLAQTENKSAESLNLIASENIMSKSALRALSSDLAHRYVIPPASERSESIWDFPNQEIYRAITKSTEELAKKLYKGKFADVRPLSGNNAVYVIINSLVPNGGTIFRIPANCGGHFATEPICHRENIRVVDIPYDREKARIDFSALKNLYERHQPQLIFLDASMILFPHPVGEIREALGNDAVSTCDCSQVLAVLYSLSI